MKILIAEDDENLAQHVRRAMVERSHAVGVAHDGENAEASTGIYDVIVLDIMLPKRSGLDVLSALRKSAMATPTLLLTARDRVFGQGDRARLGGRRLHDQALCTG